VQSFLRLRESLLPQKEMMKPTAGSDSSMAGKVCLVTGATAGIGAVTAQELSKRGAAVVVVGRSQDRCRTRVEAIRRATGNDSVEFLVADLSSQAEVRRLVQDFLKRHDRLHVLVNNAGAMFALRRESVDGIEMTLALRQESLTCPLAPMRTSRDSTLTIRRR
jgi:NAD(P)-dependent dehydrogenase (short-subunit alcohol dehydrogenase family)